MLKNVVGIFHDYIYLAHHHHFDKDPLLPNNRNSTKPPILLLPGAFESWHIFDPIVVPLIDRGFPVFAPDNLGQNYDRVEDLSAKVQQYIDDYNLQNVVLIGHSKGGLVGKYAISYMDPQQRINKLIAVATPFTGSRSKMFIAAGPLQELAKGSDFIQKMDKLVGANSKIINIKAAFDNHIWGEQPPLPAAKNVTVPTVGHHRILEHPMVLQAILDEVG